MTRAEKQGLLAGLLAVCCWSGFVLVTRLGGQSPLLATDTMAIRFVIGGLLLLPFVRGRLWLNWKGLTLALVGGVGYSLLVYQGFRLTSAVHASVMLPGLIPFAAALFSVWILGERIPMQRVGGLALIGVGALLMLLALDGGTMEGDLWLLASVVSWALYTVLARLWQVPPLTGAVTTGLGSAMLFLPVFFVFLPTRIGEASWSDIALQGFYQGVIATVVAMLLYLRAVATIGPSAMGALMALVPVISGFAAALLLGESISVQESVALVMTSAGAFVASGLLRSSTGKTRSVAADGN
ncbi:DMT family transporter [Gilvimarinus sp. F26214L]|uniref:DMT family transporter n=1 Tax=Gilvimarinus sp. DZF01 TaxID=3461371 RepID=UPI004046781A